MTAQTYTYTLNLARFILLSLACFALLSTSATAQQEIASNQVIKNRIVEAGCGQCQFHLKGKGCDLAVRIDGKAYFVDGTDIDDHGDAHTSDGFCLRIRKALVTGRIINGRFQAESFQLMPLGS